MEPPEITEIKKVLAEKKAMVVKELIFKLSCSNTDDLEGALNASSILTEVIEASSESVLHVLFMKN